MLCQHFGLCRQIPQLLEALIQAWAFELEAKPEPVAALTMIVSFFLCQNFGAIWVLIFFSRFILKWHLRPEQKLCGPFNCIEASSTH